MVEPIVQATFGSGLRLLDGRFPEPMTTDWIPAGTVRPGDRVRVPYGSRRVYGSRDDAWFVDEGVIRPSGTPRCLAPCRSRPGPA